jgi:hypothetical protein
LYGIDGTAVDPHFKVQRRGAGGGQADPAHLGTGLHRLTLLQGCGGEVSIKRIAITPMVQDDKGAKSCERTGIADRSTVDGPNRGGFFGGDFNAVPDRSAAKSIRGLAERADETPLNRPLEGTLKWP